MATPFTIPQDKVARYSSSKSYFRVPGSTDLADNAGNVITDPDEIKFALNTRGGMLSSFPALDPSTNGVLVGAVPRYAAGQGSPVASAPSALEAARSELYGSPDERKPLGESGRADIRSRVRNEFDDFITFINSQANSFLEAAKKRGENRLGQARAMANARGLFGSPFETTMQSQTEQFNQEEQDAIEAERNVKLSALFKQINDQAEKEIEFESGERTAKADQYIKDLEFKQTEARNNIAAVASLGTAVEALPQDIYQKMLKTSGYDPLVFKAVYNANLPKAAKREYHYETVGNTIVAFSQNPKTGALEREEYNVSAPPGYDEFKVTEDGTPLFINKKTGTAVIAPGFQKGSFNKPPAPPESYKEWKLAGSPGGTTGYGQWLANKNGVNPSKDEISAATRYAQTKMEGTHDLTKLIPAITPGNPSFKPELFYEVLQKSIGDSDFQLQPFKYPFLGQ